MCGIAGQVQFDGAPIDLQALEAMTAALLLVLSACSSGFGDLKLRIAAGNPGGVYDKLAQTLAYGAKTLLVRGDFDACFALVREAAEKLNVYLLNSVNPFRIEGQKTIIFEMLEQLSFEPPDWIGEELTDDERYANQQLALHGLPSDA